MADRFKLAAGLRNLPETAREDLAGREQDIQRGKTVELLRRAGKEMYENPIVNTAVGLSPVLGDIQSGVEAYRSAQAGDWGNAGLNAVGMLPFIPMLGKTVWHGSPHSFDKFDLSKIGTGEGAQAYGHGLYLAESPKTAEHYKYAGETVKYTPTLEKFTNGPNYFIDESGKYMKARDWVRNDVPVEVPKEEYLQKFNEVQAAHEAQPSGSLYKVDLPDEQIAKMLDWDKPLSEQPESVRNALTQFNTEYGELYPMLGEAMNPLEQSATTGQTIYNILGKESPANASKMLRDINVPGIQYLDQASRGAGEGTRNYVVFSDEIPQILERNGQPVAQALRNYEAPKQSFDVTKQDASDIFGEGASRIRYQDPNTQGFIDVLQRPDGTASVLGLEVPEAARGRGVGQSLQQQVLSDFPEMQGQVSSKAAATTAHRLGRRPVGNPEATLDDVFRMIDEDSSVNLVSPEMQKRFNFGG